ncbi:hypothetical protein [Dyadobacter sp. LHD-138]|uniref:hypothetical protein n=1 Tax=Dyadobacter sp. LHD-138 TaxID=3071413 RepID=UPI0027E1B7D8|nr:hypothetical protein [Dyadobacter sp. LHD-138]MDQ6478707.1 hypothetical protein [Dyadobacter sp. LHD-138]
MKKFSDKKDRLERFVRDNRDGFDVFLPQDSLWDRIENSIPSVPAEPQKKVRRLSSPYFDWRIAAGVILALGTGYLFYLNNEYGVTRDPGVALKVPAYAREFNQYNTLIDEKRSEILKLASNSPELYRDFSADLKSLENSYQNLKSDLGNAPNQEALIRAMIENLQFQVDLLNRQLNILQRINKATQSHEKYNSPTI